MLNETASIKWADEEKFKDYKSNVPVYLSSWENHIRSWIDNKFSCPFLILNYEDLVYNKSDTIEKLIDFFEKTG